MTAFTLNLPERPQPIAQALAAMLKRAEPPICVGLYARWGAGKTFMISQLKKQFDPEVREEPRTRGLLQFFEKGYEQIPRTGYELGPEQAPAKEASISSLIYGLLLAMLLASVPYGAMTFFSIMWDAFAFWGVLVCTWSWCSKLILACIPGVMRTKPLGKTAPKYQELRRGPEADGTKSGSFCQFLVGLCKREGRNREQKKEAKEEQKTQEDKEFIFVDFNAWECAAVCTAYASPFFSASFALTHSQVRRFGYFVGGARARHLCEGGTED